MVLYAVVGLVGAVVFALAAVAREPFEVRALRVRGLPYRVEEGVISNLLTLAIQNKSPEAVELTVEVRFDEGPAALAPEVVVGQPTVRLEGLHEATVPVFVRLPRERYTGPFPLRFVVRDPASGAEREVEGRFLGP